MAGIGAAGVATQAVGTAAQLGLGLWQYLNAIKQAKRNTRPFYNIDPSYQNAINTLTHTMGLPQSALNLYYQNIGQNTNQGINAILGAGGNGNQISNLVGGQNQNYLQLALQDALQKKTDITGILGAQNALADQRDKQWQINKYAPYADKAQAISNQKVAGLNNITGAFNSAAGAAANSATSKLADTTTPNSGVNTNAILQYLRTSGGTQWGGAQNMPPNYSTTIPQTQNPYNPYNPTPQPFFQSQSQQNQLPFPSYTQQNSSPYGNTGLDYQSIFNYIMNLQQ